MFPLANTTSTTICHSLLHVSQNSRIFENSIIALSEDFAPEWVHPKPHSPEFLFKTST